jgi:hypothetical protein
MVGTVMTGDGNGLRRGTQEAAAILFDFGHHSSNSSRDGCETSLTRSIGMVATY